MSSDLLQKEIAEQVGVTQKTMSKWVTEGKWDEVREAQASTRQETIRGLLAQMNELNQAIAGRAQGERYPTSKEADILSKLSRNISFLDKQVQLKDYVTVLSEELKFIKEQDLAFAKTLSDYQYEFLAQRAEQG